MGTSSFDPDVCEGLDAELVVAGTHGEASSDGCLAETVAKLVRGARRSVLVLPHAAAFQGLDLAPHENGAAQSQQLLPLERQS